MQSLANINKEFKYMGIILTALVLAKSFGTRKGASFAPEVFSFHVSKDSAIPTL